MVLDFPVPAEVMKRYDIDMDGKGIDYFSLYIVVELYKAEDPNQESTDFFLLKLDYRLLKSGRSVPHFD